MLDAQTSRSTHRWTTGCWAADERVRQQEPPAWWQGTRPRAARPPWRCARHAHCATGRRSAGRSSSPAPPAARFQRRKRRPPLWKLEEGRGGGMSRREIKQKRHLKIHWKTKDESENETLVALISKPSLTPWDNCVARWVKRCKSSLSLQTRLRLQLQHFAAALCVESFLHVCLYFRE